MRQPILDLNGLVHGYELLFRTPAEEEEASSDHGALAILDNLVLFGLDRLTGGSPAFFNGSAEALTEDLVAVLPPNGTVLEIPVTREISPGLLDICRRLKGAGFRFALTGFTENSGGNPLLSLADYVKVDAAVFSSNGCAHLRQKLGYAPPAMIAVGIHSQDSYRAARAEGFKYFQGFYFCHPDPVRGARIPTNQAVHVEILRELLKDPLDLNKLCPLVLRDASLVYHVLRLVNSPAYAIRDSITSIESAILILGDIAFRRIATLAIHCALNAGRPREILHMALIRARFCSECAPLCNLDPNEQYFLGMLSLLPAMLVAPMEAIVPELPLRHNIRQALLGSPIHERCLLDWIECHEKNRVSQCQAIAARYGLSQPDLMHSYVQALVWDTAQPLPAPATMH